jgi:hypothetical protein
VKLVLTRFIKNQPFSVPNPNSQFCEPKPASPSV